MITYQLFERHHGKFLLFSARDQMLAVERRSKRRCAECLTLLKQVLLVILWMDQYQQFLVEE
jgi:hypothetical protein